jgi:hypothetical protein
LEFFSGLGKDRGIFPEWEIYEKEGSLLNISKQDKDWFKKITVKIYR